jgi:hypothetical protein
MRILGTLAIAGSGGDTEAPTQPQNLIASAINRQRIDLTWTASTDNIGVTGYQIFRGGNQLTTTTLTSYSDTTVTASTAYSYTVVAYDGAGNNSQASASAQATTPANASPSWQAIPDQTLIVGDSYALNLNDFCTDADADTVQYSIPTGTLSTGVTLVGASISGTPTVAGQISTVTVRAYDGFVNVDTTIDFSTFDTDVTAPPVPAGLNASASSSSQITLTWSASTDVQGGANEYVSGTQDYRIYRATDQATFSLRSTTSSLSYPDTGLSASTRYDYKIAARDTELNESTQSAAVNATTTAVILESAIRFHPGHYGQLRTVAGVKTSESVILADLAVISANSGEANIVGWAANFAWKQIETSQGVYDFTTPDRYFNACKAIGKRFIFRLDYRRYSGDGTQSVVPAYLYPAGQVAAADGGATPRDWEASVMDRIIACYQAIAAHYDSDSMFEAVQGMVETSVSFDATYPAPANYTTTNKKTQYKRWMDAVRGPVGFQSSQVWFGQNYLGNENGSDCEEMIIYAMALRIGVGGPDTWQYDWVVPPNQSGKRPLWSDEVARGVRGSGTDYRPSLAWPREAQGTEMGGYIGNMLPQNILQSCNYDGSQWMIWDYITAANTPGSTAATQWGNGSAQGTLWVIRNQAVTNTTNPYASGFYQAGHWSASRQALRTIYPRPNAETPSWARHRWAYYDGSNTVQYRLPIGVMGGAWPYVYTVVAGPSGLSVGRSYGDTDYGIVKWTPNGSQTGSVVTIRITDQELNTIDVTWTISTSSSTAQFLFVSTSGNDTTGNGTISAPYATIQKVYGSGGVLNPNRIVYFRGGTYATFAQNATFGINCVDDTSPMAMQNFPGETVTFNHAIAGSTSAWSSNAGSHDWFVYGIGITGGPVGSTNFRHFHNGGKNNRLTIGKCSAPDVWGGTSPDDNATVVFLSSTGSGMRQYLYFPELVETNRSGGNCGGGFIAFTCQYLLAERCSVTGSTGGFDLLLKAATQDCELRESTIVRTDGGQITGTICQIDDGIQTANIHIRHNYLDSGGNTDTGFVVNNARVACGAHWLDRNSIRGGAISVNDNTGGPSSVAIAGNAIQVSGMNPVLRNFASGTPPNTTIGNTECHGSSGILDANILLTGAYRTSYYGTANSRGAEIA